MADLQKALTGAREFYNLLQRADNLQMAAGLKDAIEAMASYDNAMLERQKVLATLDANIADKKLAITDQSDRTAAAQKAADDVVAVCAAMCDKAKSDQAVYLRELADAQSKAEKAAAARVAQAQAAYDKYVAEVAAAKAATEAVYAENRDKYNVEINKLKSVKAQLEGEIAGIKDRLTKLVGA